MTIPTPNNIAIADEMQRSGGGFVHLLGRAFCAADPDNRDRILAAFPEYFEKYKSVIIHRAMQNHQEGLMAQCSDEAAEGREIALAAHYHSLDIDQEVRP
jgi:hypothetical protein